MQVVVDEEYGYRFWKWEFPGTPQELIEWWKGIPTVLPFFFDPSVLLARVGPIEQVEQVEPEDPPTVIHLHDNSDSWLRVGGVYYYHQGRVKVDNYSGSGFKETLEYIQKKRGGK